jgi:predicted ATPase
LKRRYAQAWQQLTLDLRGLKSDSFDEKVLLPKLYAANDGWSLFQVYLTKTILLFLLNDDEQAVESASLTDKYVDSVTGLIYVATHYFYYSLAILAHYPSVEVSKQLEYLKRVESNQQKLQLWASHAPMNFQHKYDLVEAEKRRVLGQLEAIDWYERAIVGARNNQYIQEEALAYELAAKYYLGRGMDKIAQLYMKEAHYRYQQWGAVVKVEDLED